MKTRSGTLLPARAPRLAAFTLTEIMVAMAIFTMVVAAVITVQMFGLRMFQISKAKLGASDDARAALGFMTGEIRSAKLIRLGDGNLTSFTEVGLNSTQVGTAIQLYPFYNDTNNFVRYYWDSTSKQLRRTTNGASASLVIANYLTNNILFRSENFDGTVHTNNQNNRVIAMTLQFYQLEYPNVSIGSGSYYDFYQLRTRITRRTLQ